MEKYSFGFIAVSHRECMKPHQSQNMQNHMGSETGWRGVHVMWCDHVSHAMSSHNGCSLCHYHTSLCEQITQAIIRYNQYLQPQIVHILDPCQGCNGSLKMPHVYISYVTNTQIVCVTHAALFDDTNDTPYPMLPYHQQISCFIPPQRRASHSLLRYYCCCIPQTLRTHLSNSLTPSLCAGTASYRGWHPWTQ